MKKKVLVFAPNSIHTKKFIDMVRYNVNIHLVTNKITFDYGVEMTSMDRSPSMPIQIRAIIKESNPDFIHIHTINRVTPFVILATPHQIPIVLSVWGSSVLLEPWKGWWKKKIVQYCLNNADVITVDACIERYMVNALTRHKNMIINANFGIIKNESEFDSNNKQDIIYSPRNHASLYNIEKIIDSFYEFHKTHQRWKLYLSGYEDPVNTPHLMKKVQTSGLTDAITFLGHITQQENARYMDISRIVVSVPVSDGKSHSVMEAINANTLCFVSDVPSSHELITHGVNGFIVDDNALIDFSLHEEIDPDFMRRFNKAIAMNFSNEHNADKFLNIYK